MTDTMTEEQKKFLEECEIEFKDRYTEKDSAFMKIKSMERNKPPIVDPWYKNQRNPPYDWIRQNQGHGRRNHSWRDNDKNERWERHAGKHYPHHNYKPH